MELNQLKLSYTLEGETSYDSNRKEILSAETVILNSHQDHGNEEFQKLKKMVHDSMDDKLAYYEKINQGQLLITASQRLAKHMDELQKIYKKQKAFMVAQGLILEDEFPEFPEAEETQTLLAQANVIEGVIDKY